MTDRSSCLIRSAPPGSWAGGAGFPTYRKLELELVGITSSSTVPSASRCCEKIAKRCSASQKSCVAWISCSSAAVTGDDRSQGEEPDVVDVWPRRRRRSSSCWSTRTSIRRATSSSGLRNRRPSDSTRRHPAGGRVPGQQRRDDRQRRPCRGRPAGDRQVGDHLRRGRKPITTVVPVGTSIGDCLELAGGATVDEPVVLTGGLMMGGVETELDRPVTKTLAV